MEVLADSKIRKYMYEKEEYLSVLSFNSKWQYIRHVVSLHVFKYSCYVYPASRVSTCSYTSTCTCMYI